MKTHSSDGFKAFLLPILLAIALITAIAVAACSDDNSDEAVSDEPAAEEHVDDADEHSDSGDVASVEVHLSADGAVFTPEHPPAGGGDVDLSIKNETTEAITTMVHVHGVDGEGEAVVEVGEIAPDGTEVVTITLLPDTDYVFLWESPMIHVELESGHEDDHDDGEHSHDDEHADDEHAEE